MDVSKKNYYGMESFSPLSISDLFFEENSMFSVMDVEVLDECNFIVSLKDEYGNGIGGVEITISNHRDTVIASGLTDDEGIVVFVIDEEHNNLFKVKSYSSIYDHTSFIFT